MSCSICVASPPKRERVRGGGGYLTRRAALLVGFGAGPRRDEVDVEAVLREERERLAVGWLGVEVDIARLAMEADDARSTGSCAGCDPANISTFCTACDSSALVFSGAGEPVRLSTLRGELLAELSEILDLRPVAAGLCAHCAVIDLFRDDPGSGRSMRGRKEPCVCSSLYYRCATSLLGGGH